MMNLISVSLLVTLIITRWLSVSGNLVVQPKDVVVALGQLVQLNCSTDDKYNVNWWHVPIGSTTNEDVYISSVVVMPYHPRFLIQRNEVENSIHHYNLVISSVRRGDAGKYTCIDRAGHGDQSDAQLVVLESNPECHSNIDGNGFVGDNDCKKELDDIRCSCGLQYFGNNPPDMEWTNSAGQMMAPQPPVDSSQANTISSNLTMKSRLTMNGTSIVWRAVLLKSNNWTSPDVKVKYVMNSSSSVNATHGESMVCSANSSEICSYRWTMQNGTVISEAANLTIVETGTYFCDATCPIDHDNCTVRSMVAEFKKIQKENTGQATNEMAAIAAGVIVVICLVSLLAVLFVVLLRQRIKRREKKTLIPCDQDKMVNTRPLL